MPFSDYSTNPSANTELSGGTFIGPNMDRNNVRPALQQLAADGRELADALASAAATGFNTDPLVRPDLASSAPGKGAALVGFSQDPVYAQDTVGAKLKQVVSVKDPPFNAKGDGTTDDTASIIAAIAANPGRTITLPPGTYLISASLGTIPANTHIVGCGKGATTLKKNFNGDLATLDLNATVRNLSVDGQGTAGKTGRGFVISTGSAAGTGYQKIEDVSITDMHGYCVEWTNNAAGWGGGMARCDVQRTGNAAACLRMPASEVNGNRLLHWVFAGSGTLIDLAGAANVQISDCTSGSAAGATPAFVMTTAAAKVQFVNNRFATGGGTSVLLGQNHTFTGNSHAGPFTLGNGGANSLVNSAGSSNEFAGYAVTDLANTSSGSENKFDIPKGTHAPAWTAASVAPGIGNGEIVANYAREGNTVIFELELTAGTTTTFGTGLWSFSLPVKNNARVATGQAWMFDASASAAYVGAVLAERGATTIEVYPHQAAAAQSNSPFTWAEGDRLRLSLTYIGA